MGKFDLKAQIEFGADAYDTERGFKVEVRRALQAAGKVWHGRMLPDHFKESAYGKYRFRQRSKKWADWKRDEKGHNRPNVLSGRTKRMVMAAPKLTASGRKDGSEYTGRVRMKMPDYMHYRKEGLGRKEIQAQTFGEVRKLASIVSGRVRERMERRRLRAVKRIRRAA